MPSKHESDLGMSAEDMRRLADAATTSLIARLEGLRDEAPWRGATRSALEAILREPAPERGQDPLAVLERAVRDVLPIAARVDHPRFFAFVPSAPTWPGVIADYLAAGFNTFQGTWLGSGGPSQLELVVIDWFRQWVGYPETAGGSVHLWRVGCNPRRASRRPRAGGLTRTACNFPERSDTFGDRAGSPDHRSAERRDRRHPVR